MEEEQKNLTSSVKRLFPPKAWTVLLLFIFFFIYALFLLQGLSFYMYGYDDFHIIYQSLNLSFMDFLSSIFFKPLQLYQGFLQLASYQRAFQGIFLKIIYMIGAVESPIYFHMFKAIFFTLNGIIIYIFTKKMIKNEAFSIAAGFLYCSFPVIYDGLRHTTAAEPFSDFFLLLSIYLFVGFYQNEWNYKGIRKYTYPVLLFILGLFAIKARETGILVLAAFGGFLILHYKELRRNTMWWIVLVMLSLYLVPALLYSFHVGDTTQRESIRITSDQVMTNIQHLLLYNPETRTGSGEQTFVLFSLRQYFSETPGSLLGSFGFFIGWYTIIMIFVFICYLFSKTEKKIIPSNNYFTIACLWFVFSILLIILYVNVSDHSDIRYISIMALPAILVLVPFCYFVTAYIKRLQIRYLSQYIFVIFFVLLFLSIVVNAGITSVYRRGGIGSRHVGMAMSTEIIFEDMYNQSFDNSYFFALTEISGENNEIQCTINARVALKDVIVTNDPFLSFVRPITEENLEASLAAYGVVYVISYAEPLILNKYPDLELIQEIDTCQEGFFCDFITFLKKQRFIMHLFGQQLDKQPRYFVYRILHDIDKNVDETSLTMFCLGEEGVPQNRV